MQPRVTAILVARDGEAWLGRTLDALAASRRRPDEIVLVDAGSSDGTPRLLAEAAPRLATSPPLAARGADYGSAVAEALGTLPPTSTAEEWLWLLAADTAPEPDALRALLAAVEISPSVAIAGPKLVDPEDRALLRSYGETLSLLGATVPLVEEELDQAQHDRDDDVMGVAVSGMLVRRAVWDRLGGLDRGLPAIDAGLDLSVRARLAGHRVVRVAAARVVRARRPEDAGRPEPLAERPRARLARRAQLHRRLVYARLPLVPVHWLALLPLAVLRAIGHLLAKRPGLVAGEFAAAVVAAVDPTVPGARGRLRRARRLPWSALAPLRMPGDELRERRASARERRAAAEGLDGELVRPLFLSQGGIAVVAAALVIGLLLAWRLLGASHLSGGALLPLADDPGALWRRLGWGLRDPELGTGGPADPFAAVLALLGSATAWNPSYSLVLVWIAAPPLAALGAWWCATRFSRRPGVVAVIALLWAVAPPLLVALAEGRPGAVLAHLLLPWLVLAVVEGARSWSAAAAGSLLFAATVASAPSLAPALALAVVVWALSRPRAVLRLIGVLIPAAALAAPLVVRQLLAGHPLALLADPGPAAAFAAPTGWQLLVGLPTSDAGSWSALAAELGLPAFAGTIAGAVLLVPLGALALLGAFLPGSRRAIAVLAVALLGLATAVGAAHLGTGVDGLDLVTPWPGAGLSLYWLGLLAAAATALDATRRAAAPASTVLAVLGVAAALPVALSLVIGGGLVRDGGRELPALVVADGAADPGQGTLVIAPLPDGSLGARVVRGAGETLDSVATLATTSRLQEPEGDRALVAELAGNLATQGGYDPADAVARLGVRYVLVPPSGEAGAALATALDAQPALEPVGDSGLGALWRTVDEPPARQAPTVPRLAPLVLAVQGAIAVIALLLAIPTGRGRRRVVAAGVVLPGEDPADTFDEDENA